MKAKRSDSEIQVARPPPVYLKKERQTNASRLSRTGLVVQLTGRLALNTVVGQFAFQCRALTEQVSYIIKLTHYPQYLKDDCR